MKIKDIRKYISLYMEGAGTLDLQKNLLIEHQKAIIDQIDTLKDGFSHIQKKIEMYESPDAVQRINTQIKKSYDEKQENNLL